MRRCIGRYAGGGRLPLGCVLSFRPSVRPFVRPSACRSAPKIPGWNPWEPRRTELNAYNPFPGWRRPEPSHAATVSPFSCPRYPGRLSGSPSGQPRSPVSFAAARRFLSRAFPSRCRPRFRGPIHAAAPRGISIRDWFSLKRSKRIIASRRGNASNGRSASIRSLLRLPPIADRYALSIL